MHSIEGFINACYNHIYMYKTDLKNRILEAVTIDEHYVKVKESLQQNDIQHKYKDSKL
jgi:hypothetical protein